MTSQPLAKKKIEGQKTAFQGDVIQACKLTDEAISEILEPFKKKKKIQQTLSRGSSDFGSNVGSAERLKRNFRDLKPKTVSFIGKSEYHSFNAATDVINSLDLLKSDDGESSPVSPMRNRFGKQQTLGVQ